MTIYLEIVLYFGVPIYQVVKELQNKVKLKVEGMTSMPVKTIDVSVRSLTVRDAQLPDKGKATEDGPQPVELS